MSDTKLIILQNILTPSEDTCNEPSMYYHDKEDVREYNGYFNIFSIHKWLHYTVLKSLFLHIECRGMTTVYICNESGRISEHTVTDQADIKVEYGSEDKVVWFECVSQHDSTNLIKAYYYTTDTPTQDVKLALDICTFKREAYVRRNMDVLSRNILDNPDSALYGKVDVYIIDNGQSLDRQAFETEHIKVYPNMNAGGAGGFTRGLIEILHNKQERGYTHMIFLDDDAVQEPDAFVRTAAVMSFIKPEYSKASIAGSMLRLDRRYVLHEAGALWTGTEPKQPHQGYDLRKLNKVIDNEQIYEVDYGAWFYACYPLSVISEGSLPLPIFIHMDDIEYGLRNHNGVIVMNGICIWHDAFDGRRSSSMGYYDMRNSLIMNAIHDRDGGVAAVNKMLLRSCVGDCFRYRYDDFKIKCYAVEEFLKGPEYIGSIDPVQKNSEVSKMGYANAPVDTLTKDKQLIGDMQQLAADKAKAELYRTETTANKKKCWLTFNGIFLPAKYRIKALPMNVSPYEIYRVKEVILFDPDSMKGFRVKRSLGKTIGNILLCIGTQLKMLLRYNKVKQQYKNNVYKLMNDKFWREYLKMS